jgi:hypothetical protein
VLARSRRPDTVVQALLTQIGAHARPDHLVVVEAVAVGGPGGVVLVPTPARTVAFEHALADLDVAVAGAGLCFLDAMTGVVVVGAAWLDLGADRLDEMVRDRALSERTPPALAWGRYELLALATSEPGAGRAFGEIGPTAPFGDGRAPLGAVLGAAHRVPRVVPEPASVAACVRASG